MKKILLMASFLLVFFLTTSVASAHGSFHFGFFLPPVVIGPPVISAPPPAYYPDPYGYHSPGYYGYRAWVPGYWAAEWTGHGWVRVWHPGHWEYRP
jgi:hypothetical protein